MSHWTVIAIEHSTAVVEAIPISAEDEWDAFAIAARHLSLRDNMLLIAAIPGWPGIFPPCEDGTYCEASDYLEAEDG